MDASLLYDCFVVPQRRRRQRFPSPLPTNGCNGSPEKWRPGPPSECRWLDRSCLGHGCVAELLWPASRIMVTPRFSFYPWEPVSPPAKTPRVFAQNGGLVFGLECRPFQAFMDFLAPFTYQLTVYRKPLGVVGS